MSHNHIETLGLVQVSITNLAVEAEKAEHGNKAAAVRARKHASAASKLLKQLRAELLPLT